MMSITYNRSVKSSKDYSSSGTSIGVTSDVLPGETPDQAMERVRSFVLRELAKDEGASPAATPAQAASVSEVNDQLFDLGNQLHRNLAANVMDHLKIKNEHQENKMKYVLKGKRVGDMRELLVADRAAYLAKLQAQGGA